MTSNLSIVRRLAPALACAALLGAAALPSAASADVHWVVSGVFDDNGTLSGYFDINQYGYLQGFDLVTTTGTSQSGFDYNPTTSYFSNGAFFVDAQPGYQADLHLEFLDALTVAKANNPIKGGENGPSYECLNSFNCYLNTGGSTRYLAEGFASAGAIPEPGTWALMLVGFGGVGALVRRSRRRAALA